MIVEMKSIHCYRRVNVFLASSVFLAMTFLTVSFVLAGKQTPAPGLSGKTKERVALVIGNSAYSAAPLKNAVNDSKALAGTLAELGFGVDQVANANLKQLDRAVDSFISKLGPNKVGLFYFAGHGVQVDGENYLIPVDFVLKDEADLKFTAYSASRLNERMEKAGTPLSIIILDACRDNPFRSLRSATQGLALMSSEQGTFIAFSTAPGKTADDNPNGENGLFTTYLLETLREPGLDLDHLFSKVRFKVATASKGKQVPWTASGVVGDFYLNDLKTAGQMPERMLKREGAVEAVTVPLNTRINSTDEAEMVFVPEGSFSMGNDGTVAMAQDVDVAAFWIYRYEVTNEQFVKFVEATGYRSEGDWKKYFTPGKERHPVVNVSWNDAGAYARWVGARLPTEAEWEKAAQGNDRRPWAWGSEANATMANVAEKMGATSAVGSFSADVSPYGCFDMTGNVREWTASLFVPYSAGEFNHQGSGNGERVVRGGSYHNSLTSARVSNRDRGKPNVGDEARGFRCAISNLK